MCILIHIGKSYYCYISSYCTSNDMSMYLIKFSLLVSLFLPQACAPRYVWFSTNKKRRDPVGTCFVAKDSFTEFVEYSPCRTSKFVEADDGDEDENDGIRRSTRSNAIYTICHYGSTDQSLGCSFVAFRTKMSFVAVKGYYFTTSYCLS